LTKPGETPPETPELDVLVASRRWRRVSSLFGVGPRDEVYIVREADDGTSWVQFGDGKTGARLPSGIDNVHLHFRTGNAAFGFLRPETTVQAGARLERLDRIQMPGEISGGDEPEGRDSARAAAPGKVQGLDRLVSLRDFETEALAIGGVSRAAAAWRLVDNVPTAVVTILMDTGREAEIEQARGVVAQADRRRGAGRFPVVVHAGRRVFFSVDARVALDGTIRESDATAAIRRELAVAESPSAAGGGPMAPDGTAGRTFGEPEYTTRLEGRIQRLPAVQWVEVTRLELMPTPVDLSAMLGRVALRPGRLQAIQAIEGMFAPADGRRQVRPSPAALAGLRRVAPRDAAVASVVLAALRRFAGRLSPAALRPGPDDILTLRSSDLHLTFIEPQGLGGIG
jgi:predicted phage baseplate assembly protein